MPGQCHHTSLVSLTSSPSLTRCLECSPNYLQCKQMVSQLPPHHKQAFDYLTGNNPYPVTVCLSVSVLRKIRTFSNCAFSAFLREVLTHSAQNGIDPKILATLFCSVFLRVSDEEIRSVCDNFYWFSPCRTLPEQTWVWGLVLRLTSSC